MLTQLSRSATMLKTPLKDARVFLRAHYASDGSALAETIQASCPGFDMRIELESEEPPEKVAKLVRVSERSCYAMASLLGPTPVGRQVLLNGQAFDPGLRGGS